MRELPLAVGQLSSEAEGQDTALSGYETQPSAIGGSLEGTKCHMQLAGRDYCARTLTYPSNS
jgi:hypothetical protein